MATQSNHIIGIQILDKIRGKVYDGREFGLPWMESANACFQINHRHATIYIDSSLAPYVSNGWACRGTNNQLRGWHFGDELKDAEPETLSFRHLITYPKDASVFYFLKLDIDPGSHFWMFHIGQAVRNYIEINE